MKKETWKAGNMVYPLPAVMVSCGRRGESQYPDCSMDGDGVYESCYGVYFRAPREIFL